MSGRTAPGTRQNKEHRNKEKTVKDCGYTRNATMAKETME
jgi:hypothetical protein